MILSRKDIRRPHLCSWGISPDDIEILEKEGPASLATRELVRVLEVGQVLMVSEDGDRM